MPKNSDAAIDTDLHTKTGESLDPTDVAQNEISPILDRTQSRNNDGSDAVDNKDRRATWLKAVRGLEDKAEFSSPYEDYELPSKSDYIARRDAIERLKVRDELGRRLIEHTRLFANSFSAQQAINCGWTDAELFALDGGLIPIMVIQRARGFTIKEFTSNNVHLQDSHSNVEVIRRPDSSDVAWWLDQRLIAYDEDDDIEDDFDDDFECGGAVDDGSLPWWRSLPLVPRTEAEMKEVDQGLPSWQILYKVADDD